VEQKAGVPSPLDTFRGLALHEFAENHDFEPSIEIAVDSFEEENGRFPREEKDKIRTGAERIHRLYEEYINPLREKEGYQYFPEGEYLVDFHGHTLTTKLDVLLLKRGHAIIIDYKTGNSMNPIYFREQMAFYKLSIVTSYTIPEREIETKCCFPLAPVANEKNLKSFLIDIPVSTEFFNSVKENALKTLSEIETDPKKTPCLNRMCKYCEFRKECDVAVIAGVK
jgi:hypothetical protein